MLNENQLNALPERIYERFRQANAVYLEKIGKRIGMIGDVSNSQIERLQTMYNYGEDIATIKNAIIDASQMSASEFEDIFSIIVEDSCKFADVGLNNPKLQEIITRYARQTQEYIYGVSQTTAFVKWDENEQNFVLTDLADAYQSSVEQGIIAVNTGVADYRSTMRETIKTFATKGIRTIDYATGYSRRLDTAVRQNIIWGIKQCNQEAQREIGKQIGSNGFEVSYHSCPRPSHGPMGGMQFADSQTDVVIDGKTYPSFYQSYGGYDAPCDLLEEYNCLHFTFPIILGVSEPNYDNTTLQMLKQNDARKFEFEGHEYNGYEATQMQRKIETEIRKNKDIANIAKAAGDDVLRRNVQYTINSLKDKYVEFSKAANLPLKNERMSIRGFRSVKPCLENELQKSENSGIIDVYRRSANRKVDEKQFNRYKEVLGKNAPKTFEEFRNIKYSLDWNNFKAYSRSIQSGELSPLADFFLYKSTSLEINTKLVGQTTSNGILITGKSSHFISRIIGSVEQKRNGVCIEDVLETILNPEIIKIKENKDGLSHKFKGKKCFVSIKPESGKLIQTNPRKKEHI